MNRKNAMWGGRFDRAPADLMLEINASVPIDRRLYAQDIRGSEAHAEMLAKQGIITEEEAALILGGLEQIKAEIERGAFEFRTALEDVHMNIEARLKERIGPVGGKLHTARSRNDQVAVDFKMFVREQCLETGALLKELRETLRRRALEHAETAMPGMTHLQTAQPVSFGFYLQAYFEMFGRDIRRFENVRELAEECPLGAASPTITTISV